MNKTYCTDRLVLKQLDSNDAELVLDYYIRNKEFLKEWEAEREDDFYTLKSQKLQLEQDVESYKRGSSIKFWIFKKGDEENIIGCVSFQNILRSIMQSCILGYKLDFSETGKGYLGEALKKAVHVMFSEYYLHRIEAPVMPKNTSSINVLKRLGFVNEGITNKMMKVDGAWEDHIRWSLLNPAHE
ncbi:GNAT family N-acetyltransferase [Jeotgalibacillus salarius]|uniref:GNAT family N-acetyltransferase n=1 Tax=Jeotgalibacillus salarius TaxID=546023 RepID=A0A4Y8LD83_9BACL|nr:GNAT family N-acetyltransferase [Jeotgalibacillus salarius]TFE00650.1 GNAT family N-acetyltransferase [Jeotgalibacillus salarius]